VKKLIPFLLLVVACVPCVHAQVASNPGEQHVISDQDIELMRQDIRSHKKQLMAQNLKLSGAEAARFWPVYDKYVAELTRINDKKFELLQRYADQHATITDEQALTFAKEWTDFDTQITALRQKYVSIVADVISGRNTAMFIQLDRRMTMMIELQIASKMPMARGTGK